ncbi:hypothetical protein GA0061099_101911 [Bradyrhizobium yuanmingense]|uniref:Uncharacterized protein n=2 Tax=Bradyrhizobium yuanmingense TaxID=108015 RepID=A0A1C3XGY5_9BRAD|nr:hypothetical protein IQ15_07153 [Bradyrhizobium yuanmingense]SCB51531.1 hypothetical protein GA0061099_101911 [Bradyrhizobium yuanmingense]
MLQFFAYAHLKPELQPTSVKFAEIVEWLVSLLPRNPERTACFAKLVVWLLPSSVRARQGWTFAIATMIGLTISTIFAMTPAPVTSPMQCGMVAHRKASRIGMRR